MTHNEIEACVIEAKNGSKEELVKLFNQYKPFIIKSSRQFNIKNHDINDMLQLGYIAVMKAAAKYNPGSNTFSTYVYCSIKNTFRTAASKNIKLSETLSLNTPVNSESGTNTEFIDCIAVSDTPEDKIVNIESKKELRQAIKKLPKDELDLITMIYYSRATLQAYADKNKLSYAEAYRKKNRVLKKLNKCMNM